MKLKTRTNQPVYYKLPVSSNIQSLSDDLLNSLRVGDVVQKKTGNQKHCYIVTYKEEKHGICLSYFDGSGYMESISYDYTGGHWVFNSKDVTQVPTSETISEMLVGKYVRIMEAPSSTTLTDEQIAQITKGVFINGTFLGYKNPILFPAQSYSNVLVVGLCILPTSVSSGHNIIGMYAINTVQKFISLQLSNYNILIDLCNIGKFNEKIVPAYPANTGSFTLKCVDGVLTWVQDL